jgi:uncharacterized protein YrrD
MAEPDASLIQHSDLMNRLVLDRSTAEDLGRVDQVWLSGKTHQVTGLSCKSGLLGRKRAAFAWGQVETIGEESVLVTYVPGTEVQRPEDVELLIGHELWTDGGNRAGTVVDYRFDARTGAVVDYLFVSNGWRGRLDGVYRFAPQAVISVGRKRLIVQAAAVEEPEQVSAGLADRVTQVTEFLKDDYARTKEDMKAALEGTQAIAAQVQGQGQKLVEQAQDTVAEVGDRLRSSEDVPEDAPEDVPGATSGSDPEDHAAPGADVEAVVYGSPIDEPGVELPNEEPPP